jgi:hypothetical protein
LGSVAEAYYVSCEVRTEFLFIIKRIEHLIPVCWLEVSLHLEDLSIGQLDDFVSVFFYPSASSELVPKCHVAL